MKLNSLDEKISELESTISTDDDISSESDIEIERDKYGNILKFSSILTKESILPLPKKYLPMPQCTKRKSDSKSQEPLISTKKRKVVFAVDVEVQNTSTVTMKSINSGLQETVKEMLKNYIPASQEKLPFYCRVCQFRGLSIEEFAEHKLTESHNSARCIEQSLTFCKVCKKQFTSPDQMKEHLKGKAHSERIATLKLKQGQKKC